MATQCATHWDSLAHASYGGVIYNGYPASTVSADGAARSGIAPNGHHRQPGRPARCGPGART